MFASQPGKGPSSSSSSSSSWWSRMTGGGGGGTGGGGGKAMSPEERYRLAVVAARVFIDDSNARVARVMERHNAVANSNYWYYGYFGANMMAAVALCLAAGSRVAVLRRYSGWCGLAWGYFGGTACLNVHKGRLLADVVRQIDREVAEAQQRDEQTGHLVPDYHREVRRLEQQKTELTAHLRGRHAGEGGAASPQDGGNGEGEAYSPDVQADDLVNSYMRRREAMGRRH